MQGKTINGYTLERLVGTGGMAEIWLAENKIGKKAAVKLLLPKFCVDETIVERFENEAKVMVQLDHPNIRQVYDYDQLGDRPCILMEYLEGSDLKALMKQEHCFTDQELVRWWNQMAQALNYTHSLDIVHRDIKPSNIFIDRYGNVRLMDFGIAKNNEGGSGTLTGSVLGTRIYMSPEQVKDPKRVDYRTDLYSLAVTFVHLLTGKAPYDNTTNSDFEIQMNIVMKPLDLSEVREPWRAFLEPYLEKEPNKRPQLHEYEQVTPEPKRVVVQQEVVCENEATVLETVQATREAPIEVAPNTEETMLESVQDTREAPKEISRNTEETVLENTPYSQPPMEKSNVTDLEFRVKGIPFVMKRVEGGTFWMGANNGGWFKNNEVQNFDPDALSNERPVHETKLDGFYLGETPVTQVLWEAVMGKNPSYFKGDDLPVENVSWNDCQEFIVRLNFITAKNFRLPTEAEWEFAARGGVRGKGCKYAGSDCIENVAWYNYFKEGKPHVVKQKQPNELGLYDMSGDVWEWCQDKYGDYDGSYQSNPQGPTNGAFCVLRGGCWNDSARYCRVSSRYYLTPDDRYRCYGFRLALSE